MPNYILPIDRTKLTTLRETAELALSKVEALPCSNPEQEAMFAECAKHAHEELKRVKEEREELTRPLLQQKREVEAIFNEVSEPLERLKELCKRKRGEYHLAVQKAQQKALRLAEETAKAGRVEECAAVLATVPELPVSKGVSYEWVLKEWDVSKVPARFLTVDEKGVKFYLKGLQEGEIPIVDGLVFEKRAKVRV